MKARSPLADWRNTLRDATAIRIAKTRDGVVASRRRPLVDASAKTVGLVLSTFANSDLYCSVAIATIAESASLSDRAAGKAVDRLESGGFLELNRSRGRGAHTYRLTTPNVLRRCRCDRSQKRPPESSERDRLNAEARSAFIFSTPNLTTPTPNLTTPNTEPGSYESSKKAIEGVTVAAAATRVGATDEQGETAEQRAARAAVVREWIPTLGKADTA